MDKETRRELHAALAWGLRAGACLLGKWGQRALSGGRKDLRG